MSRKHSHYFRSVSHLKEIDIYRLLDLFNVTDQALGHAIKKLVVPGMRGGGKPARKDIEEAIDTLQRRLEMMDEDAGVEKAKPFVDPYDIKPHCQCRVTCKGQADGLQCRSLPVPIIGQSGGGYGG